MLIGIPAIMMTGMLLNSECPVTDGYITELTNHSACSDTKVYHLDYNTFVTVCLLGGDIILDVRRFVNDTASIKGIGLNLRQWLTLKTIDSRDR